MSVLDQIDSLMTKKAISELGYKIDYFSVTQSTQSDNLNYFIVLFDKNNGNLREQCSNKKELANFLNWRGFKIYTESKSQEGL